MSTRGLYGFIKNGKMKATYNHWDSYPSGLGKDILNFIRDTNIEDLNKIYDKIILVDENKKPSKKQIEECKQFANLSVSEQSMEDWYCLLRETQGDLSVYLGELKYMIDSQDFLEDSVFCEYAYIINLDSEELEFYHLSKLIKTYKIKDINSDFFVNDMEKVMNGIIEEQEYLPF